MKTYGLAIIYAYLQVDFHPIRNLLMISGFESSTTAVLALLNQ